MAKGRKKMVWVLVTIGAVALIAFGAVQYAIARNGPAVLDTVDRIVGGSRDTVLAHRQQTGEHPHQKVRVFTPENGVGDNELRPVMLFVHGGSWRSGDPDDYNFIGRNFVDAGFVVVLGGYRIDESGAFPGMITDTAAAIAWTHANAMKHGGDPDRLFVAGHSAGAYNVAMTALDPQWLAREGLDTDIIKGVIGLAGPYDFLPLDSDATKAAFGDASDLPATQPINFARSDAPPMLLLTGEKDTTVYPRNTRRLAAAIESAGGTADTGYYPEMDHYDILLATARPWQSNSDVMSRIATFTQRSGAEGETNR